MIDRLKWATEPVPGRSSMLLWGGMAAFLGGAALLMKYEMPWQAGFTVYALIVAGWIAAACGAVGYIRWLFGQNIKEAKKDRGG